jgi:hypothetical protein
MSSTSQSSFDAPSSAIGYLYQCRYALIHLLHRLTTTEGAIQIEALDDIQFQHDGRPIELLQLKHHTHTQATLGDTSSDLWKTVRIWASQLARGEVDPSVDSLGLLTTSSARDDNLLALLRPDRSTHDVESAFKKLDAIARKGTPKSNASCYQKYLALDDTRRRQLVEAIVLFDNSPKITQLEHELRRLLYIAVPPDHLDPFRQRLEGWWYDNVVKHLAGHIGPLRTSDLQAFIDNLRDQFKQDNLPVDFADASAPDSPHPEQDTRNFVRQLAIIHVNANRIRNAQIDHYRAYSQRSRWLDDNLLNIQEWSDYEKRLIDEWRVRFDARIDDFAITADQNDDVYSHCGRRIYEWVEQDAPLSSQLMIRASFTWPFLVRGSYHMLADNLRIGWHPYYLPRLNGEHDVSST